jgi:hypothetical protein
MLKRRQPKQRQVQVTPRALEIFRQMQPLERGSDAWYDLHLQLHREVGAKVWEYPLDSKNGWHIWTALTDALEAAERVEAEASELARRQIAVAGR